MIFLEKGSHIFLIVCILIVIYLWMRLYIGVVKDWRDSSLPKFVEKAFVSFFLVGPCILLLAIIIGVIYIFVTADDS